MSSIYWFFGIIIILSVLSGLLQPTKKSRRRKKGNKSTTHNKNLVNRASSICRADEDILKSPLDQLTGAEFERLLALYFRDQNYKVEEVGVGGKDGGVDLVITDKRGEKTAVQAKCYADHNNVRVHTVRELVGAKRNYDCILSLLVTTSDLTLDAKKEAEQFKVDYWHGALTEQKLQAWGKWQPSKRKTRKKTKAVVELQAGRTQTAVSKEKMKCVCGADMDKRRNKLGEEFWGCSTYPKCRHTKSI